MKGGWQLENSSHVAAFVLPLASNVALTLTSPALPPAPGKISVSKSNYQKLNRTVQQKTHVSWCTWDFGAFVCPSAFLLCPLSPGFRFLSPVSSGKSPFSGRTCHCFQQEPATDPGIDIDIVWQRKSKTYQIKVCTFLSISRVFCELNTCSPSSTPGDNFSGSATILVGSTATRGVSGVYGAHKSRWDTRDDMA